MTATTINSALFARRKFLQCKFEEVATAAQDASESGRNLMIVVIAARLVLIENRGHERTIKPRAGNLQYPGVADSGRDFFRGGADQ